MVRGYHVYRDIWSASLDEELVCAREPDNYSDLFAVAAVRSEVTVGHIPGRFLRCVRRFFDAEAPSKEL